MEVLAGDIGGTHSRLALFRVENQQLECLLEANYASQEWPSLESLLEQFVSDHSLQCRNACFGIAGPIRKGVCDVTSLPWLVDSRQLKQKFGFLQFDLINDLEANGWGISALSDDDFCELNPGTQNPTGNRSIISAGTGLGQAGLYWDGEQYRPFASEGGHADFSPGNEIEFALFLHLSRQYGHVSWERVVSGPGLVDIHQFLCSYHKQPVSEQLAIEMNRNDPAAVISQQALNGTDSLYQAALDLWVSCYAAEAGNHALKIMATGGVYLGGGIAPKILPKLQQPEFITTFCAKGRMQELMQSMPVRVILNPRTALFGPALFLADKMNRS